MSLALVLPAYNEAERIGPALDELFTYLVSPAAAELPRPIEVLVVDDGSTDATAALVVGPAGGGRRDRRDLAARPGGAARRQGCRGPRGDAQRRRAT